MSHTAPRPTHNRHAPKTQTTSPKTPQIHAFSPKWSAFWAIPCPAPVDWRGWKAPEGPEDLAAVPVGGGGAWPDRETTRQARSQYTRPHWCGGPRRVRRTWPRCPWAVAGPGQASRRRTEPENSDQAPLVWRAPEGPEGLAAAPVGGGGAWPGFEIDHSEPQARVWRSCGRAAAHGRIKQHGLTKHTRRPKHPWRPTTTMTRPTRCAAHAGTGRGSG